MILIATAGKVGAETALLLAQRGEPVRVLVRDPEKATALAQAGAEVTQGDLEVPATIDAAMQGVSTVVLVSPAIPAQELNVVTSAVRAGALSKVLGRLITLQPLTVEEQTQAMVDIGLPESLAAMNAQAVALFADGDSDYVTDDVPSILGRPARSFEQFATDYAASFS
jgi:putative NADH-flavin reductase